MNIGGLVARPGSTRTVRLESPVAGLDLPLAHVPGSDPLVLDLRLDAIVEGIHVSGRVAGAMRIECRRCLAEVERTFAVEVDEIYTYPGLPELEEGFTVSGDEIDLERMTRDAVVLAMPLNPLCREDCRGLCPACGQDLNVRDCGHGAERTDVRWEPLRRLGEARGPGDEGSGDE